LDRKIYIQGVSKIGGHILDTCSVDHNKDEYPIVVYFHSMVNIKVKFALKPALKS